jgi:nucleotide-binding universal stress UspA family protein
VSRLHRILAAVDFSAPARAAFDYALALSRMHDAELTVVHAVPSDRPFKWHARERIALIGSLRHAAQAAGVRFKVSVMHGDPAGVITLHANARRADLILLGSSERSGFDRFRFGSVAETVALEAKQPVLVVPSGAREVGDRTAPFKNILVAVDFGEGSQPAVDRALSMANGSSRVTVLHVVPGAPLGLATRRLSLRMESEYHRHLVGDAWRKIPATMPATAGESARVHARVVTGDPSSEIARVAAEIDADLILLGVTSRGAVGRLVFGSTAARVIRTAGRPVLAVPQLAAPALAAEGRQQLAAVA